MPAMRAKPKLCYARQRLGSVAAEGFDAGLHLARAGSGHVDLQNKRTTDAMKAYDARHGITLSNDMEGPSQEVAQQVSHQRLQALVHRTIKPTDGHPRPDGITCSALASARRERARSKLHGRRPVLGRQNRTNSDCPGGPGRSWPDPADRS